MLAYNLNNLPTGIDENDAVEFLKKNAIPFYVQEDGMFETNPQYQALVDQLLFHELLKKPPVDSFIYDLSLLPEGMDIESVTEHYKTTGKVPIMKDGVITEVEPVNIKIYERNTGKV